MVVVVSSRGDSLMFERSSVFPRVELVFVGLCRGHFTLFICAHVSDNYIGCLVLTVCYRVSCVYQ